jgi:NAD-dependent SIR2 family protein deacetylase
MYCQRSLFKQKRQIVVLLGAGAAMPWGGVTSEEIKDLFINDNRYKVQEQTLGKFIFHALEEFYKWDCANFETFLAVLEEIMNYVMSSTNDGGVNVSNTSFIPAVFELKESIITLLRDKDEIGKRRYCVEMFYTYVKEVIKKINEYNEKVLNEKYAEINKNLVRFTKYFLTKNNSVKYYTTNYDSIIPQVLSKHCNIYEGLYKCEEYKRFKYNLGLFRKARLSHFNLHGSIFLHRKLINSHRETVYNDDEYTQLQPEMAMQMDSGNPNEPILFSPIITGYNKTQRAADQPYSLGFNAFVNDCNDCAALCVVGYSVSDPHINTILSSYIKWNNVRFMYVTRENENIEKLNNEIVQVIEREKNDTWIHDGRKHIYKDGFKKFLNNKSNWKYLCFN